MLKLSVGYNKDKKLLPIYGDYPEVDTVWFGIHLTDGVFGSGRVIHSGQTETFDALKPHVSRAHELGMKVNFLFNSVCTGNREYTPEGIFEIRQYIHFINDMEIDYITVGNPFIATIFKQNCPGTKIKLSSHYVCDNMGKFEAAFDQFGIHIVTVSQFANKHFKLLRQVVDRYGPDRIEIMCSVACIMGCPYMQYHNCYVGHGNTIPASMKPTLSPCMPQSILDPVTAVSMMFVRREDFAYYQELGIQRFKIGERVLSTEGCLDSLLYYLGYNDSAHPVKYWEHFYHTVDLKALDGFYDVFFSEQCAGTRYACRDCDHCANYAAQVFQGKKHDYIDSLNLPDNPTYFKNWIPEGLKTNALS